MHFDPQKFDEDMRKLTGMYTQAIEKKRLRLDLPKPDDVRGLIDRRQPYFAAQPPPCDLLLRLEWLSKDHGTTPRELQPLRSFRLACSVTCRMEAHLLTRALMADSLTTEDDLCRALEIVRGFSELTEPLAMTILHRQPSNKTLRAVTSFSLTRRREAMLRLLAQDPEARDLVSIIQVAREHDHLEEPCFTHGKDRCSCRWDSFSDAARQIVVRASQMLVARPAGNDELLQALRASLGLIPVLAKTFLAREPNEETLGEFLLYTPDDPATLLTRAVEMALGKLIISNATLSFSLSTIRRRSHRRGAEILHPWAEKAAKRLFFRRPSGDDLARIAASETAYAEPAKARFKANWPRYFLHASGVGSCHSPFNTGLTGLEGREARERLEQDAERFHRLWKGEKDS